jgi:hypothetical protein
MQKNARAIVGLLVAAMLLLTGCHRLGLVTSPGGSKGAAASTASGFSVAVENGGGIRGRGAAMATKLKSLGFNVLGKATNAPSTDLAKTEIMYKPGHQADATKVQQALAIGTVQPEPASVTATATVLVVVGQDF